ncbi:hypothetical protein LB503_010290 [Fusarium chuoi]|nr:hypothetical protein LB503_010290 [Fusarium chuoi]
MSQSNVGYPSSYEGGDQRHYRREEVREEVREEGRTHPNVNPGGYRFSATMHGNKPSRGAEIDADLAREDAEQLERKKDKTDSMPGKKM